MANITLKQLKHSYLDHPQSPEDYALQEFNLEWRDGGAYALLGPSGCGKTTLLNLISGLHTPSEGTILFDKKEVTHLSPEQRNIAQVFQFPVIYDTMSVYDNLAFPLKNRHIDETTIHHRVAEVAAMLEISELLPTKALSLSPDNKQKLSMGRGLVRDDVNVIMFDEPLTVIDPHLKWKLRSKLKQLHQRTEQTMIYVTHDQTEALSFADEVVVMNVGQVVQIGTPVALFERPEHTFIGHFIGSPGMNVLPCEVVNHKIMLNGHYLPTEEVPYASKTGKKEVGIRPEFVSISHQTLSDSAMIARVTKVTDVGRHYIIESMLGQHAITAIHRGKPPNVGESITLEFQATHTRLYVDGWLSMKNQPKGSISTHA